MKAANRTVMRALAILSLLAARPALAQDEAGAVSGACNVRAGALDINERGELVQPPPTVDDCANAADLIDKFLGMDRQEFRRIVELEPIPGNVRIFIGGMAPFGGPWNSSGPMIPGLPNRRHIVTHASDSIVVVVYESADMSGIVTSVLVIDLTTQQVCTYLRWPETSDPRSLSVEDIQEVLDSGLSGERPTPTCLLKPLITD